jgi:hypothetical protein
VTEDVNQFGFHGISNRELRVADIPAPDAEFWGAIDRFALTFDGYAQHPDDCGDVANAAAARYSECGDLPASLSELRTCLFFEQRRWRHFGEDPDADALRYVYALLDAIRIKVHAGELE